MMGMSVKTIFFCQERPAICRSSKTNLQSEGYNEGRVQPAQDLISLAISQSTSILWRPLDLES